MYFTEVNISGAWTRRHRSESLMWAAEGVDPGHSKWINFHDIRVKVVRGHTLAGTRYLNVYLRGLNRAKFAIGGLLGEASATRAKGVGQWGRPSQEAWGF
ncbi:unnamed protein product [Prorocentrum cordatum]|uniref:F5/8 type C domain-containing protein n=1 Tax=Prorocentrum cordatum TaxID=2364126 RepID=A0ABN9VKN8_9DINO|nr:unnamed protein product [Polarella glacialis]